ncbi:MAG: dihydroxy-acid dehydratase [Acidobacteria bacterium]|nr:dihydroxy-acid dehydratase [Acidobacteriota bacterium]MCI0623513.1 dihydroxy-acid dehydratase [Acidobacteriota bacterium]MCI0724821.1 dihydroxy-acid dehydratase [Acidobacteriota bacterium]
MNNGVKLRSADWFGRKDKLGFVHRSWMRTEGFSTSVFQGKPVIGICNSWSELTNCNAHLRQVADAVKRGVWAAGGFPLEFPTISLGEPFMRPSTMMFRNLMAMDVEESIRANPIDGVVLLCGCDKTTPAQLMGAISVDVPAIMVTGGPMLNGVWRNREIGSGTDVWHFWDELRAGRISDEEFCEIESCLSRSAGHCMTMGTASTMTSIVEALGMTLTGCASVPAADSRRYVVAEQSGTRIVEMVREDLRPTKILTRQAMENAISVDMAIGGSTNAIIHFLAFAGRLGMELPMSLFDEISRRTPFLVNVRPSGKYLMEDFFYAGGLPAVMKEMESLLHLDALTATGKTIGENIASAQCYNREVIRSFSNPLKPQGGTVILYGNLCPNGSVLKTSAASEKLMQHTGRAVVFEDHEDLKGRLDDPSLDVDETCVLVLKNGGPVGAPGMPEWGNLPIPAKLYKRGVEDMVRISDARMSGTSYGTVVLHIAPESALGGSLAIVQNGDLIQLDTANRKLNLLVSDEEIERRLAAWEKPVRHYDRGYGKLFLEHILQANEGCDFDFLKWVPEPDKLEGSERSKARRATHKLPLPF